MIGIKQNKIWGWTFCIFKNDNFEVHLIYVKKNMKCSEHLHRFKNNLFFILFGCLNIKIWKNDYSLCDETIIKKYQMTNATPNEYHQFKSIKNTFALEIYFSEPVGDDIERRSVGGKIDKDSKGVT